MFLQPAAIEAMQIVAQTLLRDGSSAAVRAQLVSFKEHKSIADLSGWTALDGRYSGASAPTGDRC